MNTEGFAMRTSECTQLKKTKTKTETKGVTAKNFKKDEQHVRTS